MIKKVSFPYLTAFLTHFIHYNFIFIVICQISNIFLLGINHSMS